MTWLQPVTLRSDFCTLAPLSMKHLDDLLASVQDGQLWKLWYTNVPKPDDMASEINRRLKLCDQGLMLPFAVIDNLTDQTIGMTTYLNISQENLRVEIGGTWYRKSAQRTGINTSAKTLLLTHAFEKLNCNAVEFRTHFHNRQSRQGIERLGAKLDGVLRNHRVMPSGTLGDACVYSIIKSEWPTIKSHLTWLSTNFEKNTHRKF